jgi:hypothetical protein
VGLETHNNNSISHKGGISSRLNTKGEKVKQTGLSIIKPKYFEIKTGLLKEIVD